MGLNRVILKGEVVRAPELRWGGDDHAAASFTVRVVRIAAGQNGESRVFTTDLPVVVQGPAAESCARDVRAGDAVIVEGRLRMEEQRADGKVVASRHDIVAWRYDLDVPGVPRPHAEVPAAAPDRRAPEPVVEEPAGAERRRRARAGRPAEVAGA
jgi:single-stranded DNA-binding protein